MRPASAGCRPTILDAQVNSSSEQTDHLDGGNFRTSAQKGEEMDSQYGQAPARDERAIGLVRDGGGGQSARPRLMRASDIDRTCDPKSPLGCILDWIRTFLARPH